MPGGQGEAQRRKDKRLLPGRRHADPQTEGEKRKPARKQKIDESEFEREIEEREEAERREQRRLPVQAAREKPAGPGTKERGRADEDSPGGVDPDRVRKRRDEKVHRQVRDEAVGDLVITREIRRHADVCFNECAREMVRIVACKTQGAQSEQRHDRDRGGDRDGERRRLYCGLAPVPTNTGLPPSSHRPRWRPHAQRKRRAFAEGEAEERAATAHACTRIAAASAGAAAWPKAA